MFGHLVAESQLYLCRRPDLNCSVALPLVPAALVCKRSAGRSTKGRNGIKLSMGHVCVQGRLGALKQRNLCGVVFSFLGENSEGLEAR